MTDEQEPKVVDLAAARVRLDPLRKEKAASDLKKQFQKAMGWTNKPKPKKNGGGKGPKGGKGRK